MLGVPLWAVGGGLALYFFVIQPAMNPRRGYSRNRDDYDEYDD